MEIRKPYDRVAVVHTDDGKKVTQQHFMEETNILNIVNRYGRTGQFDHLNPVEPLYGDFTMATDLQSAIDLVDRADEEFMQLPASVRKAADNDRVKMLAMLATPEGTRELAAAGLEVKISPEAPPEWQPKPEPTPGPSGPVSPAPAGAPAAAPAASGTAPGAPAPSAPEPSQPPGTAAGEGGPIPT